MKRKAFTLSELLVVVAIIAVLAAVALGALQAAREVAKESATRATIAKLDKIVMERYESYRTRRLPIKAQWSTDPQPIDYRVSALRRLYAIRDLQRMEMPCRLSDIHSDSMALRDEDGTQRPNATQEALRRWLQRMETNSEFARHIKINPEIFYAWVMMADHEAAASFTAREIGDTDQDGALEFVDGWGQPILFLRWPVSIPSSEIQSADAHTDHDPYDSRHLQTDAFRVIPIVYSGGRDLVYGLETRPTIDYGASAVVNPFQYDVGAAHNEFWADNIDNHRMR